MITTNQMDGDLSLGRNLNMGGDAEIAGHVHIGHDLKVDGWLKADNVKCANKGLFPSFAALESAYPSPEEGWFAGVLATDADLADLGISAETGKSYFRMYLYDGGGWNAQPGLYEITVESDGLQTDIDSLRSDVTALSSALYSRINSIDLSQIAFSHSWLQNFCQKGTASFWQVTVTSGSLTTPVGVLLMTSDNLKHVVTQAFFTHYTAVDGVISSSSAHDCGKLSAYVRTYGVASPFSGMEGFDVVNGSWSGWRPLFPTVGLSGLIDFSVIPVGTGADEVYSGSAGAQDAFWIANLKQGLKVVVYEGGDGVDRLKACTEPGYYCLIDSTDAAYKTDLLVVSAKAESENSGTDWEFVQYWFSGEGNKRRKCRKLAGDDTPVWTAWANDASLVESHSALISVLQGESTAHGKTLDDHTADIAGIREEMSQLSPIGNDFNATQDRMANLSPRTTAGGSTYYDTLETAIEYALSRNVVNPGVHLTFALADGSWKSYIYVGGADADKTQTSLWEDLAGMSAGDEVEINVNDLCGPGPIPGGYYNLSYAIAAVATLEAESGITYRKAGLKLTYNTAEFTWETKQLVGLAASFGDPNSWTDVTGGGGGQTVEVGDEPEEEGTKAFSTGGAAKIAIGGHTVEIVDGAVNVQLQNLLGDDILEEPIVIPSVGGGGSATGTAMAITAEKSAVYAAYGASMPARFAIRSVTVTGSQETENSIASVWIVDNDTNLELWRSNSMQASSSDKTDFSFVVDLSGLFSGASTRNLKIYARDELGNTASRRFSATAEDVTLKCVQTLHYDAGAGLTSESTSATFSLYQFENATSDINVTVEMLIGGEWTVVHEQTLSGSRRNAARSITINPKGLGLTHGSWPIRMYGESAQSGVRGNTVYSAVMIVGVDADGNVTGTAPIAALMYDDRTEGLVKIYDTLVLNVACYQPGHPNGCEVDVKVNGTTIASPLAMPGKTLTVRKTVDGYEDGSTLLVQAVSGESASNRVELTVDGWAVDVHAKENALFSFNFASRSNSEADHSIVSNGYELEVSGSNYSSNGFVAYAGDTSEETSLRIAENVTAEIGVQPFADANLESNGMAFQVRVLTDNVKDPDAMLLHCVNEAGGAGFWVKGNEAAIYCRGGAPQSVERRSFPCGEKVTVGFVVEPGDVYLTRGGIRYSSLVMYFNGEKVAKIGYTPGTGALSSNEKVKFNGTLGDLHVYDATMWNSWYEWHEAMGNHLAKLGDTAAMIEEHDFEDVLVSQTAEGRTMMRPSHSALWDRGIPYVIEVASQQDFDKFDGIENGQIGGGTDTSENFTFDIHYYNPQMPWRSFIAYGVRTRRQGTTSSKRTKKNKRYYIGKASSVVPMFPNYAEEHVMTAEDAADLETTYALFKQKKVRVTRNSIPVDVITVKVDWSDSTGANDCGVCDMMNMTFRGLGAEYMTPQQRAFDGTWNGGGVSLSGLEMNHSTANHPVAVFRSTDSGLSNVFFEAKGNWKEDKGEQTALGFINTPGYNLGCINWQDGGFNVVVAPGNMTVNDYIQTDDFKALTAGWDTGKLYLVHAYCGRNYRFMRFSDGEWKATHGSMRQTSDGKWQVSGDVLNPVSGFEMITYDGMDWLQGVSSLSDFMEPVTDMTSAWIEKLKAKGKVSGAVPKWTYYFESMVDNDDLQVLYATGALVPFELYQGLRFWDRADYASRADWQTMFRTHAWKHAAMRAAQVYKVSSDVNSMKDSLSKNCQPMWSLEDGHCVVDGVYDPGTEGADDIDGFNYEFVEPSATSPQMPVIMYPNKVYDIDGANDKDNDGGCNFDPETDPDKPTVDGVYANPFAGWGSVLWRGLYLQPETVVDSRGTVVSVETTAAAMRSLQYRLDDGTVINPFSPDGAIKVFVTDRAAKWPRNVSSFDGWRKYEQYTSTSATLDFYALQGLGLTSLRQFIRKRWRFRDGFYGVGDFFSGQLTGRIYYNDAPGNGTKITVRAAKTGYFGVGNDSPLTCTQKIKLEEGEAYSFTNFPFNSNALLYMHQADRLSEIDLHELTLSGFDFSVMKLAERIAIGGEDYVVRNVTTGSPMLSIALGSLPFLEEFDCRKHELQNLDASGCPRLGKLDARGSSLASLRLAEACRIDDVQLPAGMTGIRLVGLPELSYTASPETSGLKFEGLESVGSLLVRDCPQINVSALLQDILEAQSGLSAPALSYIGVSGVSLSGDGSELRTIVDSGMRGTDGETTYALPIMQGVYSLTRVMEESDIAELEAGVTGLSVVISLDAYIYAIDCVNAEMWGGMEDVDTVTLDNIGSHIDFFNGETYEEYLERYAKENAPLEI